MEEVIKPSRSRRSCIDKKTKYFINPTGRFVIGGPMGDSGLTGRKIIVDTYGGMGRHGGGAFSGKDPSKVDRSACYYARYIAKNVVAAGLARRCEVQVAYAIGVAEPVSLLVDTFGTGTVADEKHRARRCAQTFDCRPRALIEELDLLRPDLPARPPPTVTSAARSRVHLGAHRQGRRAQGGGAQAAVGGRGRGQRQERQGKNGSSKPAAGGGKGKRRGERGAVEA